MKCFNFDKLSNSINIVFKLCFIFSFLKKYNKKRTVKKSCLKPYFGKLIFIVDLGKAFPFWNFYFYMFSFGFLYSCSRNLEYLKAKIENGSLRIKRKTVLGNNIKWAEDSHYCGVWKCIRNLISAMKLGNISSLVCQVQIYFLKWQLFK